MSMKNKFFTSLIALSSVVSFQQAFANSGVINFTGEIVKSACNTTGSSKNIAVPLGKWPTSALATAGQTTSPQTFKIDLENCTPGNYAVRLAGTAVDAGANSNLLAVTGGATNVGIQVTGLDDKIVPLNQVLADGYTFTVAGTGTTPTAATVNLKAFYKATGVATEGLANATANFSIEYK